MFDLTAKPFYLNKSQTEWVKNTFNSMTHEEKIAQLFCPIVFTKDEDELNKLIASHPIGGVLYREGPGEEIRRAQEVLQKASKIPLLTASNLEYGGNGSAIEGTYFGRQMLISATEDKANAYRMGKVCGAEGAAVGVNWSFAPVVDTDKNYHNPITNVRTWGDDPETVISFSKEYMRGCEEEGVACCIKHFPGDGIDERDQHLVTSVNTLSCAEWDRTYGHIYKELIESGAKTLMAVHIALPAYEEFYDGCPIDHITPASLSKNLLNKLLREKLGYNGLIVTDATPMVGFCSAMERREAVPTAIENGCDMFLFNRDMEEDFRYMEEGYRNGLLSEERLNEAVMRILATKASMGLPEKQREGKLVPPHEALSILNNSEFDSWARETAEEGVTLVKDRGDLLPLDPVKHHRILLEILGDFESNERVKNSFINHLTDEGFEVTLYKNEGPAEVMTDSVEKLRSEFDLVMYVANIETASNHTTARINWHTMFGLGRNMPWMVHELPVIFISVGNPYHLLDAPMVKTYINGYCNSEYVISAIIEKIMGRSEFTGKSPVDAFCGRMDTRL